MTSTRRAGEQLNLLGDDQQLPTFVLSKASPELQARVHAQVQKVMARPENSRLAPGNSDRILPFGDVDRYVYAKAITEVTTAALAAELGVDAEHLRWSW